MALNRYKNSEAHLNLALERIPLGAQTFSKSPTALPVGASPLYISKSYENKFIDVDGNEFLDFNNALCSVLLGHSHKDINDAVIEQLNNGVSHSLSTTLELDLANVLLSLYPSMQKVRFSKNGSDATSAAIRLSRAVTGRNKVVCCGYHGWHDWYIGSTSRNHGVPSEVSDLTIKLNYNDLDSFVQVFEKQPDSIACVILEPMNSDWPSNNFLQELRKLCDEYNCLLIFDETITGFRFSLGGATEFFNVVPDIVTLGKGLSNGFPLSAILSTNLIMRKMSEIFFSGTFGGEALSLAAGLKSTQLMRRYSLPETLLNRGEHLMKNCIDLINKYKLENVISISGHPSWSFLKFNCGDTQKNFLLKTYFLQELFKTQHYHIGTHNLSYANTIDDINSLLNAYDKIFKMIKLRLDENNIESFLTCAPLKPLFAVR